MKKAKYFLGVFMFFVLTLCGFRILLSPHSYTDIFDKHFEDMTPGKNSSAFGGFNVQEYDNTKYFIDDSCNLCSKKDNKKKIIIENVENFLLLENELVYTLFNDEKNVYSIKLQKNSKRAVAHVSAKIFLNSEECLYIYSKDNYLYKYDKNWGKIETINIKKKGYNGCFERAYVTNDKIVFYTEESDVYVYDVMTYGLQKIIVPKKFETDFSEETDIIQWDGDIFYMLCYYDDGDMHNSLTRTEYVENGIYKLDVENRRFMKVSNNVGNFMLIMNNELSVVSDYFFGISYQVKKVDFVKNNRR